MDLRKLCGVLRRAHLLLYVHLLGRGYAFALCRHLLLHDWLLLDTLWLLAHVDQLAVI